MDPAFWRERWRSGRIAFHRGEVHPELERWWAACVPDPAVSVLVPLCGKSLDMRWLAGRGHPVTGVELEETAVADFFGEWGVEATITRGADGLARHAGGGVSLVAGDFFAFDPGGGFGGVYDRAALVALPEAMRRDYLRRLAACVAPGGCGLLVTFEFEPRGYEGPPFRVDESEVRAQPWFAVERLERVPAAGQYPHLAERGAADLHEALYRLERTTVEAGHGDP